MDFIKNESTRLGLDGYWIFFRDEIEFYPENKQPSKVIWHDQRTGRVLIKRYNCSGQPLDDYENILS